MTHPPESHQNELVASSRLFYKGDFQASIDATNAHFLQASDEPLVNPGMLSGDWLFHPLLDWETFIHKQVEVNWAGKVTLGRYYHALWHHCPSKDFLWHVATPRLLAFGAPYPGSHWQSAEHCSEMWRYHEYPVLIDALGAAIRAGVIQLVPHHVPLDPFPTISNDWLDLMAHIQPSRPYLHLLQEQIRSFAAPASITSWTREGMVTLLRVILKELFISTPLNHTRIAKIGFIKRQMPTRARMIQQLVNEFPSSMNDVALAQFISDATGGRVRTNDPNGWWNQLKTEFSF